MVAYYLVGGAYSLILNGHVRMDLLYGSWSERKKPRSRIPALFLVVLLIGAISSIEYALEYNQTSRSAWRPPMAPIKIIMGFGILLMLLQSISTFFKDLGIAINRPVNGENAHER